MRINSMKCIMLRSRVWQTCALRGGVTSQATSLFGPPLDHVGVVGDTLPVEGEATGVAGGRVSRRIAEVVIPQVMGRIIIIVIIIVIPAATPPISPGIAVNP